MSSTEKINSEAVRPNVLCEPCFGSEASRVIGELDDVEGQEANVPKYGFRPTPEEVERHNATHVPFRNWCAFCVAEKAKESAPAFLYSIIYA